LKNVFPSTPPDRTGYQQDTEVHFMVLHASKPSAVECKLSVRLLTSVATAALTSPAVSAASCKQQIQPISACCEGDNIAECLEGFGHTVRGPWLVLFGVFSHSL
jgi:hypothetical protein